MGEKITREQAWRLLFDHFGKHGKVHINEVADDDLDLIPYLISFAGRYGLACRIKKLIGDSGCNCEYSIVRVGAPLEELVMVDILVFMRVCGDWIHRTPIFAGYNYVYENIQSVDDNIIL
ncbi:hypothetical protein COT97_01030 [Candidatus Falkowbacteria bacterium CG10_big_fil_rev_8_21_14_0_10_39_11]|uniref:Uncharacterized protein n=1 Tax=Candidatus Falkowbacteria bacterium CG10_big_fil_rev_8_21_14_0_10_39_11 TaxID=1974565 RepID=A0A2H0V622_9BACT|nr:MAG: hypothetical protein COT97_01030 [Candidatus Falkowbacteria bacterium CG10_big_fil_rev_8_21_14_0_10_39_11]